MTNKQRKPKIMSELIPNTPENNDIYEFVEHIQSDDPEIIELLHNIEAEHDSDYAKLIRQARAYASYEEPYTQLTLNPGQTLRYKTPEVLPHVNEDIMARLKLIEDLISGPDARMQKNKILNLIAIEFLDTYLPAQESISKASKTNQKNLLATTDAYRHAFIKLMSAETNPNLQTQLAITVREKIVDELTLRGIDFTSKHELARSQYDKFETGVRHEVRIMRILENEIAKQAKSNNPEWKAVRQSTPEEDIFGRFDATLTTSSNEFCLDFKSSKSFISEMAKHGRIQLSDRVGLKQVDIPNTNTKRWVIVVSGGQNNRNYRVEASEHNDIVKHIQYAIQHLTQEQIQ